MRGKGREQEEKGKGRNYIYESLYGFIQIKDSYNLISNLIWNPVSPFLPEKEIKTQIFPFDNKINCVGQENKTSL